MLRSNATRIAQVSTRSIVAASTTKSRSYSLYTPPPPPPGQPTPNPIKQSDNTLMYTGLGLAVAAGAYLYSRNPNKIEEKAKSDAETMKQKGRETFDAAKDRAGEIRQKDSAKDSIKEKYDATRSKVDNAARDAEARGRGLIDDVEDKLGSAKSSTKDTLARARDSTENLYREVRDKTEQKSAEARTDADKKVEQTKEGWFSWLGFGKTKAEEAKIKVKDGEHQLESGVDHVKRGAAQKVTNAAEGVKVKAEKHV